MCRVITPSDDAGIESPDVIIFEYSIVDEVINYESDTIKYVLTDLNVTFDGEVNDHVGSGSAANEAENCSDDADQVQVRTNQNIGEGLDFEVLTYN